MLHFLNHALLFYRKYQQQQQNSYSVSCITAHTPQAHILKKTILKHWPILTSDPALDLQFKKPPLFEDRRSRNLRNKLVPGNFKSAPKQNLLAPQKNVNYASSGCASCHSTCFRHLKLGKCFPVKGFPTCSS